MSIDLKKIGIALKEKREEKGLAISDISDSLCLRKSLVQALENGQWDMLPHEVYVRGYLKEYAQLLGIDEDIAGEMNKDIDEKPPAVEIPIQQKAAARPKHVQKRVIIYPLFFVLIIAFFVLNQAYKERSAFKQVPRQTAERASANMSPANTEKQNLPEFAEVKKLLITCHERTWISVVIDGAEKKEFMLNPQDILVLNAKENFDILIGNAGGVKMSLNGKDVESAGQSGEVKRVKVS